jgi:hypothetical protein
LTPHHLALAATRRNETSETEAKKAEHGRFGQRGFWLTWPRISPPGNADGMKIDVPVARQQIRDLLGVMVVDPALRAEETADVSDIHLHTGIHPRGGRAVEVNPAHGAGQAG